MIRTATLLLMLAALALSPAATAQLKPEPAEGTELEPLVVEGERNPLDVIGAHRERLPCVGPCEDDQDEETGLQRLLRGMAQMSIYGDPAAPPKPEQSLGVANPIKARLDEKQP